MTELKLSPDFVAKYNGYQIPWGPLGYVTYKRTYARPVIPEAVAHIEGYQKRLDGWRQYVGDSNAHFRTEEWWETTERCVNWVLAEAKGAISIEEGEKLFDDVMNLRCSFAGRGLWQYGTDTVKNIGAASLNNCYAVNVDSLDAFLFTFDMLMLGGGVGFNIQKENVYSLPKVKGGSVVRKESNDAEFIVPDSREGWIELLRRVLDVYFTDQKSLTYSTVCIRPQGSPIAGFGGTASGPGPLCTGIEQICQVLDSRAGKKLRPMDCLDIMNIIGSIVVAGNVRRSAELALGDFEDTHFLLAKRFDLSTPVPNWRSMSNNSVACSVFDHLPNAFWKTYDVGGEPYGLVNLNLMRQKGRLKDNHRKDKDVIGTNPCLPAWSSVLTTEGPKKISELTSAGFTAVVDGAPYSAKAFWSTGVKPVYRLTLDNGQYVDATDNHEIQLASGDWVELGNLNIGDPVRIHNHQEVAWPGQIDVSSEVAYAIGHLIGDGTFMSGAPLLCAWEQDTGSSYVMDKLATTMLELPHRSDWQGWREAYQEGKSVMSARGLNEYLDLLGITSEHKVVTEQCEKLSSEAQCALLRGLFDTDGHVEGISTGGGVSVRLSQSNYEMLQLVQRMLLRLGMRSTVRPMHKAGTKAMPGGEYFCKESFRLIISGADLMVFANRIGFANPEKQDKLANRLEAMTRGFYTKPFSSDVASVELLGEFEVYDTTVEEVHCFDANGVMVHNCAEISLESGESCNLAEIYLPNIESEEQFIDVATRIWKVCKVVSCVPHHWPFAAEIIEKNHRTGLGITGVLQSGLDLEKTLDAGYEALEQTDKDFSAALTKSLGRKIGTSIKLTTVKPSGTLSLLAGVSSGIHPEYSEYYIRRIRIAANSPIVEASRKAGYQVEQVLRFDGSKDPSTYVVEFPCKAREGSKLAKDMTAIEQLEVCKMVQTYWSDNSVSVTVYYRKEELDAIKEWMAENYDNSLKSVSFLQHSEHGFIQAPLEEIDEKEYERRSKGLTALDLSSSHDEMYDDDCATGACPVR